MTTTASPPFDSGSSNTKHAKRLLPPSLSSLTPHGPINKPSRSAGEQAALEKRKNEILQSMTKEQIDAAYSGQAVKVNEHLQKKSKKHSDIDAQLTQLKAEHEMEMRVIRASLAKGEAKGERKNGKSESGDAGEGDADGEADAEGEGQEEGEIDMTG